MFAVEVAIVVSPVVRSSNPVAEDMVVLVPDPPDLVVAVWESMIVPILEVISSHSEFLPAPPDPTREKLTFNFPPVLKNHLLAFELAKVYVAVALAEVLLVMVPVSLLVAAESETAVAFGDPAAQDAASVFKSLCSAAIISIVSPPETAVVDVNVSLV